MYKVGKVFMEDVKITINDAGQRVVICPICDNEVILADDELPGDITWCDVCEMDIKLVE